MKVFFTVITFSFLLFSQTCVAQNIKLGFGVGTEVTSWPLDIYGSFQISLKKSILSFNLDPSISNFDKQFTFTLPAYLKMSFGKDVKTAPFLGGFTRAANNRFVNSSGFLAGLNIEKKLKPKLSINLNAKAMRDFYETTDKYGGQTSYDGGYSYWIGVGLKWLVSRGDK